MKTSHKETPLRQQIKKSQVSGNHNSNRRLPRARRCSSPLFFPLAGYSRGQVGNVTSPIQPDSEQFDNHVDEATAVRMTRIQFGESASTDHAAFVGETGLQCKYQVTERLLLRAGYEAIWLQGVALAPGQIQETCTTSLMPVTVQALGINCNSGVFYHGATAGLEYSF